MPSGDRRFALLRLAGFGALLLLALVVISATGSFPSAHELRDWGKDLGWAAALAYVPLFVVLNFVITWPVLAAAAGLLFGTAGGTPLALAGVTGAALAQMAVARFLAGSHAGRLLPERARWLDGFLQRHGALSVMETRLLPVFPYGLVNYSAGLTRMRFRDMALGTVVGAAPKVFAYVALGGSLTDLGAPEAKVAVAILAVLGVTGLLLLRRRLQTDRSAREGRPGLA
jgi:uncharacterized membrane protein YdjX (TVP38/TMEM64 family)